MGANKRFDRLHDFVRHGVDIDLSCRNGHCGHHGIVNAHEAWLWFRAHRWPDALEPFGGSALDHFRCTRCGDRAGKARPTACPPTVTDFFPADQQGWKRLTQRLRG